MNKTEIENTEEISIDVVVFRQKGVEMFIGAVTPNILLRLFYTAPNTRNNPKGVQRFLQTKKLNLIKKYVENQKGYLPGSGVANITKDIKIIRNPDNPNIAKLIFSKVKQKVLEYGKEDGAYGVLLDHQHTGLGALQSGIQNYELPMTFLYKAPKDLAYKIFADINSTQTPVSKVLLTRLKANVWELNNEKNPYAQDVLAVVDRLNDDPNSVLYKKIKCYQDDKKTWVASPALLKFLTIAYSEFRSYSINVNEAADIIGNFYKALSKIYNKAWGDEARDHMYYVSLWAFIFQLQEYFQLLLKDVM